MDFPIYLLKPEEAARLIVLEPSIKPHRLQFEHKRQMRIRALKRNRRKPIDFDLHTIARGNADSRYWTNYWQEHFAEFEAEFPRIAILIGPLMRDGKFYSWVAPRPEYPEAGVGGAMWAIDYKRDDFEWDTEYWECSKAALWENFVLGQSGHGRYIDAMIYLKALHLMQAEITRCKNRWLLGVELRARQKPVKPQSLEQWFDIGADEAVAIQFKHRGHTVRKIERLQGTHYEVKMV